MANYIGEVRLFAGNFAPVDWAFCNGQLVAISQNPALFSLLGTTYGGDGASTFALPDLRGRAPLHQGQGLGLTLRTIGEAGGTEGEILDETKVPPHKHTLNATNTAATSQAVTNTVLPARPTAPAAKLYTTHGASPTFDSLSANALSGFTGGSVPHENRMSSLAVSYIIALQGVFPAQN